MPDLVELSLSLADLHEPYGSEQKTRDAIVAFACHALHSKAAGVMLAYSDGHVESSAFSNDIVIRGDELQRAMAQGPGLAARPEAHVDLIADTADESRWPVWGMALHRIGIRSVISIQLPHAEGEPIGSLNIYNHRTDGFDCTDLGTAHILARHASVAQRWRRPPPRSFAR